MREDALVFGFGSRSAHLVRVALAAALTVSSVALPAEPMPDAGAAPFDWNAAVKPYACRKDQGETGSACAQRLARTLRQELSQPVLTPVSDATCSAASTDECTADLDACAPRAAAVIFAITDAADSSAFTQADIAATVPELVLAARSRSAQLRGLAIRTLAKLERPEALPFLRAHLRSGRDDCEWNGYFWLNFGFKDSGAALAPDLVPVLATPDWDFRVRVAKLLAHYANPQTAPALKNLLDRPPFTAQLAAVEGLKAIGGPVAVSTVPTLKRLAWTHWSNEVRRAAAAAATSLSGKPVSPRESKCVPLLHRVEDHWVGTLFGEGVVIRPLAIKSFEKGGACAGITATDDTTFMLAEDGDCIVGTNRGEFGGSIDVVHEGVRRTIRKGDYVEPLAFVRANSVLWIVEADYLTRLRHDPDGHWRALPFEQLPGSPAGVGLDVRGELLILATDELSPGGCSDALYLLRARPDGTLESLP